MISLPIYLQVYGYNIVRLKNNDSYILLNDLKYNNDLLESTAASSSDELISLLTIILSAIFMSGGVMQESSLNEYLKTFHIELGSRSPHPVFGNVDKLIHQDWARQCYLEIILDKMMDPPKREYKWGERAHLEFPKKWMLELVCKVYGDDIQPEMWTAQWKQVQDNP
ncbi:Melanoma-associated antigen G1 [Halocaridina rubra]|uniref:Melanoma-associated antigen G1 n=1 Tax=Halocaridina rubra TaxID=373956 RepID=A0AAN8X8V8_HALRR